MKELISLVKCCIYIQINRHRDEHLTVEQYLKYYSEDHYEEYRNSENYQKSVELDTIIEFKVYSRTPISSFTVIGYDYDKVVEETLEILRDENN